MMRGHLIVFEGVDGAGTTTQADLLRRKFVERGLPAHATAQPSGGPVGMIIRQVLKERLVSIGGKAPGWTTMALLFAADRQDQQENEIEPNLREGVNVICDRYVHSSIVYQGICSPKEGAADWVAQVNKHIRPPDLVFYLRINAKDAAERRNARSGKAEIYDDPEFQENLVEGYERLPEFFDEKSIVEIDAMDSMESISETVWAAVEKLRAKGAPK